MNESEKWTLSERDLLKATDLALVPDRMHELELMLNDRDRLVLLAAVRQMRLQTLVECLYCYSHGKDEDSAKSRKMLRKSIESEIEGIGGIERMIAVLGK